MEFSATLTEQFLKRSHAKRMFYGWWKIALAVVVAGWFSYLDLRHGSGGFSFFLVGVVAVYFAIAAFAWARQTRVIRQWIRQQGGKPVVYVLSEEGVEGRSEIGSTKLKWEAFKRLKITDFDTLLFYVTHGEMTLPTAQLPPEALEFLRSRFLAHGKKVEDSRTKMQQG
ncbi:hypothetical protein BH09VER1_BH09VER1_40310 [soil metagenome]